MATLLSKSVYAADCESGIAGVSGPLRSRKSLLGQETVGGKSR